MLRMKFSCQGAWPGNGLMQPLEMSTAIATVYTGGVEKKKSFIVKCRNPRACGRIHSYTPSPCANSSYPICTARPGATLSMLVRSVLKWYFYARANPVGFEWTFTHFFLPLPATGLSILFILTLGASPVIRHLSPLPHRWPDPRFPISQLFPN